MRSSSEADDFVHEHRAVGRQTERLQAEDALRRRASSLPVSLAVMVTPDHPAAVRRLAGMHRLSSLRIAITPKNDRNCPTIVPARMARAVLV